MIETIENKTEALAQHSLYPYLKNPTHLQKFMEYHVFCVWDFMSLLKRLQLQITCVQIPWRPSPYSKKQVRLINQIVLSEESDEIENGQYSDHFTLYLNAMSEFGADKDAINKWLKNFDPKPLPKSVQNFVNFHLELALHGDIHLVAGAFFYGREQLIPAMFTGLLKELEAFQSKYPTLIYYLKRHIELDGEEHSIMAKEFLETLCFGNEEMLEQAKQTGLNSLKLRDEMWNELKANFCQ